MADGGSVPEHACTHLTSSLNGTFKTHNAKPRTNSKDEKSGSSGQILEGRLNSPKDMAFQELRKLCGYH